MKKILIVEGNLKEENENFKDAGILTHTESLKDSLSYYTNDLEAYGWGFGFRTLMNPIKNNNLGSVGEFGWAGAASTYFLVDNEKKMTALLMTQVLSGNPNLKKDFYKFIYSNF